MYALVFCQGSHKDDPKELKEFKTIEKAIPAWSEFCSNTVWNDYTHGFFYKVTKENGQIIDSEEIDYHER